MGQKCRIEGEDDLGIQVHSRPYTNQPSDYETQNANVDQSGGSETPCITDDGSEMNDQPCESIHLKSDGDETLTYTQGFKYSSAHTHCFTSAATPESET